MLTPKKQLKEGLLWTHSQEALAVGPQGQVAGHVTAVVQLASSFFCSLWDPSSWNKWCGLHSRCVFSPRLKFSENALVDMSKAVSPWCSSSIRLTVRISNHSQFLRVACNPSPLQPERKRCLNNGNFWCALLELTYFYFLFFWCFVLFLVMLEIKSPILGKCWTIELHTNTSVLTFHKIKDRGA